MTAAAKYFANGEHLASTNRTRPWWSLVNPGDVNHDAAAFSARVFDELAQMISGRTFTPRGEESVRTLGWASTVCHGHNPFGRSVRILVGPRIEPYVLLKPLAELAARKASDLIDPGRLVPAGPVCASVPPRGIPARVRPDAPDSIALWKDRVS